MGHLSEDTTYARLSNAHPIREGALPFHSCRGMAGGRGGRERSVETREGPYPGEWQLPTSGRASGEAFPVAAAAAAVVVPGVFVPPVSRPWPAGGLGAPRRPSASSPLPSREAAGAGRRRCTGHGRGRAPSGLQAPSPWQRPRPWGRAGGGETARLGPPTVASPRPCPGGRVPVAAGGRAEGQRAREQEGGAQAASRWAGWRIPHHPVVGTTGRAPGRGPAPPRRAPASSFFWALRGAFWRTFLNE